VHNAGRVFGIQILKYKWEKAYIKVREKAYLFTWNTGNYI
jgi:hypothetical protein